MKQILSVIFCVAGLSVPLSVLAADDFEAWKREQERGVQQIKEDFRKFKDENDRQFADFLKAQWREFDTFKGKVRDPKPKPNIVPAAPPKPVTPAKPTPVPPPIIVVAPTPLPTLPPIVTPKPTPLPAVTPAPMPVANVISVDFYGNSISIPHVPAWKQRLVSGPLSAEVMSGFWTAIGTSNFEPALAQLQKNRQSLNLGDWGYLDMVRAYTRALQPGNVTGQNLLLWFFMIKSGYDVRCAYMGNDLYVFVAVSQQVYGTKYMQVKDTPYYAVLAADRGESMKSYYTYDAKYPGNLKAVDLRIRSLTFTKNQVMPRVLKWEQSGKKYQISVAYDKRAIDFLSGYPQADIAVEFASVPSQISQQSLVRELKPLIAGMNEEQAVNFLLNFVQKAFPYQTDDEQFGREKYFFAEEILFYPYSDCEDRSVFFAWLIKEMVGLDVVGLSYPGHISTAVKFKKSTPRGDSIVDQTGTRYVVTDPTYIGASIGMSQPPYAKVAPKLVVW